MSNTLPIQRQNVKAYNHGEFIGYVVKTEGSGQWVKLYITNKWTPGFPKRRGGTVLKSAKTATIAYIDKSTTLYPAKEKLTFEMVHEEESNQ